MSEPDFSGIDPMRVPEVRRRIAALEAYLALPSPGTADAVRLGRSIGMSRTQFQRLARVWRDHRAPSLIVVGRRPTPNRDYGIAARAVEIARGIIARADPEQPVTEISAAVEAACAREEVKPPSRPTIWNYVRASRKAAPASGPPRIVIGRMWFHLPMRDRPVDAMPVLLAAVLLPEGIVVAHRISTDPMTPPSIAEVVGDVLFMREQGAPARPLVIDRDDRRAVGATLVAAGLADRDERVQSAQLDLSRSLAGSLGPLDALYRRSRARPATRKAATRFEQPLEPTEVETVIERAISSSNAATLTPTPPFDVAPA